MKYELRRSYCKNYENVMSIYLMNCTIEVYAIIGQCFQSTQLIEFYDLFRKL